MTFDIIGLLSHIGYDQGLTEILYLNGELQLQLPDILQLYEKKELLGCYETVYCILYPTADPWCVDSRNTDPRSFQISK